VRVLRGMDPLIPKLIAAAKNPAHNGSVLVRICFSGARRLGALLFCRLGGTRVAHPYRTIGDAGKPPTRPGPELGLAAVRRAGRTGGRPPKLTDDDIEAAKAMLANPDISVAQIAHRLGVSPATLYRYIPAARTANTPGA
jgi:helix-turn-helix resolvase-like protein